MFYLVKAPGLLKKIYHEGIWNLPGEEKILYLTFDDGPNPEATPFVLAELKRYNAKATFFCIGKNVKQHFDLYKLILEEGHTPGNHTYSHLNGWKTPDGEYLDDIAKAAQIIDSKLFRPPYGRISKFQLKAITGDKLQLQPIFWSVLSGDFDTSIKPENCYLNVVKHAKAGSIVVFHDSRKAFENLQHALPKVLQYFSENGYIFKALPSNMVETIGPG